MNGRDFLASANRLLRSTEEADWRSAVSRAYYAAFHVARQLLTDLQFRVPWGERAHAYLWLRLSNCGDPQVESAGRSLQRLRGDRNRADYDLHHSLARSWAPPLVQEARQIIAILDTATMDPIRTQITDAMKIYERDVLQDVTWHP
jgi:uncharacterized protein (UPF0332 family)